VVLLDILGNMVINRDTVGEMVTYTSLVVLHTIADGYHCKYNKRGDLDNIDHHVDRRCARHAAICNVRNAECKEDAEKVHEYGAVVCAAEGVRPELVAQEPAEDCRNTYHDTRIYPIIQVARPSSNELGDAGELVCVGF